MSEQAGKTGEEALRELLGALGEVHKKHLDPSSPAPMRMMAARGLVPLPPRELVIVLAGYAFDAEAALADGARVALGKLPDKILGPALDAGLPPLALELLAPLLLTREDLLEKMVLARNTPNDVVAGIAANAPARVAEMLVQNQERCMQSEALVRALRTNPNLMRSSLDMLFDFLARAGVIYDDMPEYDDAMGRLSPDEMVAAAEKVELSPELLSLLDEGATDDAKVANTTELLEAYLRGTQAASADAQPAAEGASDAASPLPVLEVPPLPILKLITQLNIAKKVALAVRGNKEARAILVRDRNRVVATAAIRNPRVTEQEVTTAAQSRSVCDEVIRVIAMSKDMTRTYGVKLALVTNPKTPLTHAMRFLPLLRGNDVKVVAKSRNVSSAVANQARRLLLAQGKK